MDWVSALVLLLGSLVFLMALGLPVAIAFFGVNVIGAFLFLGGAAGIEQLSRNTIPATANFSLAPIALFILMGEILFHTGMAMRAVSAIEKLISRVPGRLSIVAVLSGTVFSSLSGSTIANTAMLGSILLPDMIKRGYNPGISMGPIMAVGGLAMLIPPSAMAIVLGSLAGISISQLLIAGIVPGILMGFVFLSYIIVRCLINPSLAAPYDVERLPLRQRIMPLVVYVIPLLGIFIVVVGSIVMGWASPSESAALGSVCALIAAVCYRVLTWQNLVKSVTETAKITVMILFIIASSITFSQILAVSGAADGLLRFVGGLGLGWVEITIAMLLILLFLGCFMEQVSIMLVTIPFFMPIVAMHGIDPIWFGIMMLIAVEIGLTTPPFGILIYVMKAVAPSGITLLDVYKAALPFVGLALAILALVFLFPPLVLWLPGMMPR